MKQLPSKVIFIGAGPSALFAARRLKQLAAEQHKEIECVFIEKEAVVGGKCHTFSDPVFPDLKSEWGAGVLAANYGVVLDAVAELGVDFETIMAVAPEGLEIRREIDGLTLAGKARMVKKFVGELMQFNADYAVYKTAKQEKRDLPEALQVPFEEYSARNNMRYLPLFIKPLVAGFGYGALSRCPTYSVLEYLGTVTVPEMLLADNVFRQPSLLAIHGGFQFLMERIAAGMDVRLKAKVTEIEREDDSVTVYYKQKGKEHQVTGDLLVLANSPRNWASLGLELTDTEEKCIEEVSYYRYPVAVYRIKGLPPFQYFFPEALEERGFGHLALITTRDNRKEPEEGRLCSVYVNLPPDENEYTFDHKALKKELMAIEGVTGVEVVGEKIWEDYMSTLPWSVRLELDQAQQGSNTMYLGSYALGGFEDVACVANKATDAINELFSPKATFEENAKLKNMQRGWRFFTAPVYQPLDTLDEPMERKGRCTVL